MSRCRIAMVQMDGDETIAATAARIAAYIRRAGERECRFILFPEMILTGYHGEFDLAERDAGLEQILAAVRAAGVATIVGTGDRTAAGVTIQNRIYDAAGELLGTHDKLLPTTGDRKWCQVGTELRLFETAGLRFGTLICNDLWSTPGCTDLPDTRLLEQLGAMGAQVCFHAISSGSSPQHWHWHTSNTELRGQAAGVTVVAANRAAKPRVNAPTGICRDGRWLVQAPRAGEQFLVHDLKQ